MSCKAPSKLLHTLTHSHTPYNVFFHATRDTEGIRRGLCNKERTKQFKYGCGINVSHRVLHTHTRSLLRFMSGEAPLAEPNGHLR